MVYADHNASAPLLEEVALYIKTRLSKGPFANPNALHALGCRVGKAMGKSRSLCADVLGAHPENLVFNSGASEGISHVFHSCLHPHLTSLRKKRVILSSIEHISVHKTAEFYASRGMLLEYLPVGKEGVVSLDVLGNLLSEHAEDVALVSVMAVNNETGIFQPYLEIANLCRSHSVPYFSDTSQLIGKSAFHFLNSNIDFAVVSGHKIGALPGSGLLLVKDPVALKPHIFGASQESGKRGGTQNYLGNESLGVALSVLDAGKDRWDRLGKAKQEFEKNLLCAIPSAVVVGVSQKRLPTTSLISFPGLYSQAIQIELEAQNIFVTTSAACSDSEPQTSKTLKAMGISNALGRGMIRISLGLPSSDEPEDSQEKYGLILEALLKAHKKLSRM